jgi:hypothetical protein
MIRADAYGERYGNACGGAHPIAEQRRGAIAVHDKTQRHRRSCEHHKGRALKTDRHRGTGQTTGRGRSRADTVGPRGRGNEEDGERDLDVVVIDAPGDEMLERRQAQCREEERERGSGAPG